jgi:hypothetical protein
MRRLRHFTEDRPYVCNVCTGSHLIKTESFSRKYPELLSEWNYQKNKVSPDNISYKNQNISLHWQCTYGHRWQATAAYRTGHRKIEQKHIQSCPICTKSIGKSAIELIIFAQLSHLLPHTTVVNGYKEQGCEIDIFIPEFKIAIEYDGYYWHKDKLARDIKKHRLFSHKYHYVNLREKGLPTLDNNNIIINRKSSVFEVMMMLVENLAKHVHFDPTRLQKYFAQQQVANLATVNHLITKEARLRYERV